MVSRHYRAIRLCLAWALPLAALGSWPTYRGDSARSGYTAGELPKELSQDWVYRAPRPCPAWPSVDSRAGFDRAYHTVISDGLLFFGSSATGIVYALDAGTGRDAWSFVTGGPVRLAPAVAGNCVYVVSDDGFLYCLSTKAQEDPGHAPQPARHWSLRGGPADSLVLGNDRLISRWPARGGPVVHDNIVYFAAGIWPSEGVFIHAVDALTGRKQWCNSESGSRYMAQPHPGAYAASGVSARGYLALDGKRLFVPTGRSVPAVFGRATGDFKYFHLGERVNVKTGGSHVLVGDGCFLNGGAAFDSETGQRLGALPKSVFPELAAWTPEQMVWWAGGRIHVGRWEASEGNDRKGEPVHTRALTEATSFPTPYGGSALIRAGGAVVSAGHGPGGHGVAVLELATGDVRFSGPTDGEALSLSVAEGKLFTSTDMGIIHCFGGGDAAPLP
ncbi:MAG: PQQ-binding-like beta-propeller repeat protein [Lentisphaerae bacterium]|jgi:outer membrane protein assembly factor BamB|nr:PQQ-binding-like beta-propeller repeat protein [Lentisphaerota bacterium]MBT5607371.1 PQQ-binding-like beta-propeller repeat protein [Lentisphaerota bacterium]MBT7058381.1 PQQ-binding-like beta-propeller repeat protein [Lentisphaerota bacterium]MBT7841698.1 PQQ-binding-like beta-propeller repeat protein [Lentisphaerota bacterium]